MKNTIIIFLLLCSIKGFSQVPITRTLSNVNNTADSLKPVSKAQASINTSLQSNITANTANIATNTANISTNATAITTKLNKTGDVITGDLDNTTTGFFRIASGTTAQRPVSPLNGMLRYNTDVLRNEFYSNGAWRAHARLEGDTFTGNIFATNLSGINTGDQDLSGKVDKITGKQLSTEDYTTAEKTKLGTVATGATANSTDANLRDRTTHTGTQPISTVSNLQTFIDSKSNVNNTADSLKPVSKAQATINTSLQSSITTNATNIATNVAAITTKLQTVSTISALQAFTDATIATFDGSQWERKAGNVASNGGAYAGTIVNVSSTVYWKRIFQNEISVSWFGAKADGINDDATAINNAIIQAQGGRNVVKLLSGIHKISSPILLLRGTLLKGTGVMDGIGGTTIKLANGANCVMLKASKAINPALDASFMGLENIIFDGNSSNQTVENDGVQFWGQYVGSYIRNVFIVSTFGIALTLNAGLDLQIDHLWLLGNKSSSGYGMTTNKDLTSGQDGTLNINHLYCEYQRKTTDPALNVYDVANNDKRSTGIYFNRLVTLNINEIHFEYCSQGIRLNNCFATIINNLYGYDMGRTLVNNEAFVELDDQNGSRTLKINSGVLTTSNLTYNWVKMTDISGSNLNNFTPSPSANKPYLTHYSYANLGGNATSEHYAEIIATNKITIQGSGSYSPQQLRINTPNSSTGAYLKQSGINTSIGSSVNQASDKDFINFYSGGNAGDNIALNAPLALGNRSEAANVGSGNIMLLNNNPVYSFGSNRLHNFVTAFSGSGIPTTTPDWIGQTYIDVTNNQMYFSKGIASSADWSANYKQKNIDDLLVEQSGLNAQPTIRLQFRTANSYIRQNGNRTIIGSAVSQTADKDFITINSVGNAGDNIVLNAPLTLGNRSEAANVSAGNIMLLNNNPVYSFGSNRLHNFVTAFSGSGIPTTTPDWIGQTYIDVTNNQMYFSKGVLSSSDWSATQQQITGTGFVKSIAGAISYDNTSYLPLTGGTLTGIAGNGFYGFISQSTNPATPASGFNLFANSTNALSWKGANGFVRTFDGTANTADRSYILPNASGTIPLLESNQTWTGSANYFNTFIGIGTTTNSGYKLDVNGNVRVAGSIEPATNSAINIGTGSSAFGTVVTTNVLGASTFNLGIKTQSGRDIDFISNITNTAKMFSNGNWLFQTGGTFTDAGFKLDVNGQARTTQYNLSALNTAPSSATATGTTGEIRWANGFVYLCVATNTWQRSALTTW